MVSLLVPEIPKQSFGVKKASSLFFVLGRRLKAPSKRGSHEVGSEQGGRSRSRWRYKVIRSGMHGLHDCIRYTGYYFTVLVVIP